MPETKSNCQLCGSGQNTLFDRRTFQERTVINCLCSNCGLVFQTPRMSDQELHDFYARGYRQMYQISESPTQKDLAVQLSRAKALVDITSQHLIEVDNHLDIGCSSGLLLDTFRQKYDSNSIGIEPGEAYRVFAQELNIKVYASREELVSGHTGRFDLISMAHVLEHIAEPVNYLRMLRSDLLTQDGALLIEVPNLYAHDCFEVAHIVSFSPHSLKQILKKAGFDIIARHVHGQPRSNLLPLYITVLAIQSNQTGEIITDPERWVRKKRQLGMLRRKVLTKLFPHQAWLPIPDRLPTMQR